MEEIEYDSCGAVNEILFSDDDDDEPQGGGDVERIMDNPEEYTLGFEPLLRNRDDLTDTGLGDMMLAITPQADYSRPTGAPRSSDSGTSTFPRPI